MSIEEFTNTVKEIYSELPQEIHDRMSIYIEEVPTNNEWKTVPFGYWTNLTPDCFTLCYWGFKATNDFRRDHIERVIKHEFEHKMVGTEHKHSEHGNKLDKKTLNQIDKENEDREWAKKKAIYGDRFNEMKFYEMSDPWVNFKALVPLILIIGFIVYFFGIRLFHDYQEHERMLVEWKQSHS